MPDSKFDVTYYDISRYDWQDVLNSALERQCVYYMSAFFNKASALKTAGDSVGERVFRFLGSIASLHPTFDSNEEPYGPMHRSTEFRSLVLGDLTAADVQALQQLLPNIQDANFRARVADILWLSTNDPRIAEVAVTAYLESATNLEDPEHWPQFTELLERATQIGAKLGKQNAPFLNSISHLENLIAKYFTTEAGLLTHRVIEILLKQGTGEPEKYAPIAENLALRFESSQNWHFARFYWKDAAAWYHRAKNAEKAKEANIRAAETFVGDAEAALERTPPSNMAAAHFLSVALESLRRAGASAERIQLIHKRLIDTSDRSTAEMRTISSGPIDLSEAVAAAEKFVAGKPLEEALLLLGVSNGPTDSSQLRVQVEKNVKDFPISHLFSSVAVDGRGKVIAQKPSLLTDDPKQLEAGLLAEMFHQAQLNWQLRVTAFINPIRLQILHDHQVRIRDMAFLVTDNPFVPPSRENIFAQGIYAGLNADLLLASHLLIPQIENSLRYILENSGVITSKLSGRLIHEERDLNSLLTFPETTELLGEDTVFDLQGLLVARFGANIRNRLAHGLLDEAGFYSPAILYTWWLILRILCVPIFIRQHSVTEHKELVKSGTPQDVTMSEWSEEDAQRFEKKINDQFEPEQ